MKRFLKNFVKGAVLLEVIAVLGSYRVWHSMNTSQGKNLPCLFLFLHSQGPRQL